ncbi:hypothetical protein [Kaistella carnis]|uniref:hypothetical protein n=1 Tax=Kaistella carnis TaxID=1241979 RepID=UPI0028A1239C|nr:hypothetical protein [Kaistella carnis]
MNKIYIFLLSLTISSAYSQVALGKGSISNPSVSLEFGTENRGIILPWVNSAAAVTGAVNGTLIFDSADKKVKYLKAGSWFDLTVDTTGTVDTSLQNTLSELPSSTVAIGKTAANNTTPGILVLTDKDKAMVLPKVANPHLNIVNPSAGMMVYDPVNKQLDVFNGAVWSFWKP